VDIKSTPDGAEITVDDRFMGSTPSSLQLAVGDHKIKLGKSGFKTWERTMTVGAGVTARVDATLEKQEYAAHIFVLTYRRFKGCSYLLWILFDEIIPP